jgi:hypothetical protein
MSTTCTKEFFLKIGGDWELTGDCNGTSLLVEDFVSTAGTTVNYYGQGVLDDQECLFHDPGDPGEGIPAYDGYEFDHFVEKTFGPYTVDKTLDINGSVDMIMTDPGGIDQNVGTFVIMAGVNEVVNVGNVVNTVSNTPFVYSVLIPSGTSLIVSIDAHATGPQSEIGNITCSFTIAAT